MRNGRLVVDEATDLPEGAEVELQFTDVDVSIDAAPPADEPITEEEARELRAIHERGKFVTHEELRAKLAARRT